MYYLSQFKINIKISVNYYQHLRTMCTKIPTKIEINSNRSNKYINDNKLMKHLN